MMWCGPPLCVRSMVFVYVVLDTDDPVLPGRALWAYFPNHYRFTRLTDMSACGHVLNMPPGFRVCCFEFPCFHDDDIWNAEDASLIEECLKPLRIRSVVRTRVVRARDAYPVPTIQNDEALSRYS